MKNILVTGGAGFIGANFVHYWLEHNTADRVVVLDALTYAGNLENLAKVRNNPNLVFVHGNICDKELVKQTMQEHAIDTVVHFAAESHVDRSILGPEEFINTNVVGTLTLLQAAKALWIDGKKDLTTVRFHHVSTDEVYGDLTMTDPAFTEETPYAPSSPYSASKAASDHLVRAYAHTYGLPITISNCSNNYGPYHFPEKLIPLMIVNILNGKSLPIYGEGLNVRDWLYVEDHCRGIELVLKHGRLGESYNIGGNNEWKNVDIVNLICTILDEKLAANPELRQQFPKAPASAKSLITYVKDRPGHDFRYAIDATKINSELGFAPKESFETGIVKTVDWYLANEAWWQNVLNGSYSEWISKIDSFHNS